MWIKLMMVAVMFIVAAVQTQAAEYYVATTGNDENPGTKEKPFRTIQKAADVMDAGDTCYVREGTYREAVQLKSSGAEGKPIRFLAYPGEVVILSGTEALTCNWQVHKGRIYKTKVDRDFVQLFVDGKMMIEARWPNMRFEELWDRSKWAQAVKGSCYGKIADPELAQTGTDFTGALATLNAAHQFYTWTRFVTDHEAGRDFFEYPKDLGKDIPIRYGDKTRVWENDRYYLSGILAALDAPTEWFLDTETKTLYLWPEDGADPTGKRIEVKARDYAFQVEEHDYIELKGFHFFGATFLFTNCNHCLVESCHLLFPTYARELTDLNAKRTNTVRTAMFGDDNTIRHSSLAYSPVNGLMMRGNQNLIENCIVRDVCWNGSLRYVPIRVAADRKVEAPVGGTVRRCTVYNFGNAGICFGSRPFFIEYNHVYNGGLTCKDVALIYTGGPYCAGCVVRYNWVHGCRTEVGGGLGIRGDDQTRSLTVHHNVVWDCGRDGIIVKGDLNKVVNNTCLFIGTKDYPGNYIAMPTRPEPVKPWRKQFPLLEVQNANSDVFNNAARTIACNQSTRERFPPSEKVADNYQGEDLKLVDAPNLDFRPQKGSPLIDAGRAVAGFTDGFKGKAPDIGAYEYGGEHWKPGHRNGLWISRSGGEEGITLRIALMMPPREPVEVEIAPKGDRVRELSFTPDNWMRAQETKVAAAGQGPLPVRFHVKAWGSVNVADARAIGVPEGATVWFEQPDIGKMRPIDLLFNTLHFPPRMVMPRRALKPVARAFKIDKPIGVDGRIADEEWPGWTQERALLLRPLREREERKDVAGEAYVVLDDTNLYVGFRIRAKKPPAMEGEWGKTDGVEVDFQTICENKLGPVFVLHGFPSGRMESVTDAGATEAEAAALEKATEFKARVIEGGWDAEFRIPFAAMGDAGGKVEKLHFNVGARVADEWFAWVKTGGANYKLEKAGELMLSPECPASAENLLRNGDFESGDLEPWRKTNNTGKDLESMFVRRMREGADGGWCIRLECNDAELMKEGVLKWIHPVATDLGPGIYVLSYDLRVANLKPRGSLGSVNAYIRTVTGPGTGRNEGQMGNAFSGNDLPWTRRDYAIEIPEDSKPTFVSLQLHKATGSVWLDNVSLIKCP